VQNDITEVSVELRGLKQQHGEIERELTSLRARRSNIRRAFWRFAPPFVRR